MQNDKLNGKFTCNAVLSQLFRFSEYFEKLQGENDPLHKSKIVGKLIPRKGVGDIGTVSI